MLFVRVDEVACEGKCKLSPLCTCVAALPTTLLPWSDRASSFSTNVGSSLD